MSEPVAKDRRTVELDEFERRLRRRDDSHEDPLAELARLVGETSDPYGEVFAQEATAASRRAYPRSEPLHTEVSPRLSGDFAAIEAGLRGTLPPYPEAHPFDPEGQHEFYAQHEQYARDEASAQHDAYGLHDGHDQSHDPYAQSGYVDQYGRHDDGHHLAGADQASGPMPTMSPREQPASRPRRRIFGIIATILLGVIGIGVAFAYKGSSSGPREIKTIEAASGPTKVQPPAETASRQDGQDSALLNKGAAQPTPTKLVNGEEQPVDISAAVQENASRDADAGASAPGDASNVPVPPAPSQFAAAQGVPSDASQVMPPITNGAPGADQTPSFGLAEMPTPKKVKVVSVRPDGTILSNDPPAASLPPPAAPSEAAAPPAKVTPKSATPKTTSRVATAAKPVKTASASDGADTPAAKPARRPKPKKVAALAPAGEDSSATDASPATSGGGFAVQLAAPGSEAEAHSATSRLAKKFAGALDGRRLGVRKAQSNGKSVFRVRVSSLTKEEAVSLCEKLKAEGGTCFIAKN